MAASPAVQISDAGPGDLEEVAQLFDAYRVFYRQPSDLPAARSFLSERFRRRDSTIFMARRHGAAIGFIQLYPSWSSVRLRPIWIVNDLFVAPEARSAGIGRRLMDRAREWANATGAARLELTTERTNTAAQALYSSVGYARDDVFYKYVLTLDTRA